MITGEMISTHLLTQALNVPMLAFEPEEIPGGGYCQITGQAITYGYRCQDKRIVPAALSDIGGFFNGNPHGWISESAARMFAGKIPIGGTGARANTLASPDWNLGSRLILADPNSAAATAHYHLLISREQAEDKGRPYWSSIAREIWPAHAGSLVLAILTTDVKKRTWNAARAGVLGSHTPILLHDGEYGFDRRTVYVDWPKLIAALDSIEAVLTHGFTYESVRTKLIRDYKTAVKIGLAAARALDADLSALRTQPEFLPALLMSQRPPKEQVAKESRPVAGLNELSLFTHQD